MVVAVNEGADAKGFFIGDGGFDDTASAGLNVSEIDPRVSDSVIVGSCFVLVNEAKLSRGY